MAVPRLAVLPEPGPGRREEITAMAPRLRLAVLAGLLARAGAIGAAPVVAAWNFDESADARIFTDAGPRGLNVQRHEGVEITAGLKGNALRPTKAASEGSLAGAALSGLEVGAAVAAGDLSPGNRRWRLSAVVRLDLDATNEGVLYELAVQAPGETPLVFSVAVSPSENAFVIRCLGRAMSAAADASAVRVAFPNPGGPPHGEAVARTLLLVAADPLPRGRWFRAELDFAGGNTVTLRVDGAPAAAATVTGGWETMPAEFPARLSLGADRTGRQPFPGAIDELAILTDPDER